MSLSKHVQTLGRGQGRSRSLTHDEAYDAMRLMLCDDTPPEAVGALLMLLRMKGETAEEIAGFAAAAQAELPALPKVDLDWPSYAAGRTRGAPWFLLSAKLVAQAGHRVLLHGWNGSDPKVRAGLTPAGISIANSPDEVDALLDRDCIAYMPLEKLHPKLLKLLKLRTVLGLRSCINTVCRMLNPGAANASVQGVFHPSYRRLQADAAALLSLKNLTVIKGGGGEFERHPSKDIAAYGLRAHTFWEATFAALNPDTRRLSKPDLPISHDLTWTSPQPFERDMITGTTALALSTLGLGNSAGEAQRLWQEHRPKKAA